MKTSDYQPALAWAVILTAALFFFYQFIQLNLFNAMNTPLMSAFDLNAAELGQLAAMYFYANALFLFPAGLLLDRFSTRKLLLWALVVSIIGTFLFAGAKQYYSAAIGRFLVGAAASFCFLACVRLASRWFPARKMALVTGVVVTMAMLGGLVAQTPLALLTNWVGWRKAVFLDGLLGIVITFAVFAVVKDRPSYLQTDLHHEKAHLKSLGFLASIKLVLLNPQNWLNGLYTSFMNLPTFLLGALWGIHYLVQVHHVSAVQASYATTLFFIGAILGSPAFGWLSDHIERRVIPMLIGAIVSLGIVLILIYVPSLSLSELIILFFFIGFTTSSQVLSYPTVAELNPPALTSTAVSVDSITIMCSGAIFQPFFGWLIDLNWQGKIINNTPVYSPHDFFYAMMIMPIAFVLSLIIALLIKETYCKPQV